MTMIGALTRCSVLVMTMIAPAWGAVEQAQLHQVRLVNLLDGVFFLTERRGDGAYSHGPAGIFLDNREQKIAVHVIEPVFVHSQHRQGIASHAECDVTLGAHFGMAEPRRQSGLFG